MTQPHPDIYNFSVLTPDIQQYLFTQICAFDIAANDLAKQKQELIISIRMGLLMRAYQSTESDDRLIICYLEAIAVENNLPRYAFTELTPQGRWSSLIWCRAVEVAITDLWGCNTADRSLADIKSSLLTETATYINDSTPGEIALYFAHIDKWTPQELGYSDMPELMEAA